VLLAGTLYASEELVVAKKSAEASARAPAESKKVDTSSVKNKA